MKPAHIAGATAILAKDQPQFEPLAIRHEPVFSLGFGVMWSAWMPDAAERLALLDGAPLLLGVFAEQHPPVYLKTGTAEDVEPAPRAEDPHPCPGPWGWYASTDGGEIYRLGPKDSREALLEAIRDECAGEYQRAPGEWRLQAEIAYCQVNHVDLARWLDVDRLLEDLGEVLEDSGEGTTEYSDRHPLEEITAAQAEELGRALRATIRAWQARHRLALQCWNFADVVKRETVDLPHPAPPEAGA